MTGTVQDGFELSFRDGKETVPMYLVEDSNVLKELRDNASCATISALPRDFFRSWLRYHADGFSGEQNRSPEDYFDALVQVIAAADYLADEKGLERAIAELSTALFGLNLNCQDESSQVDAGSIVEKLTCDQLHMLCRTCYIPQLLSCLSEQHHARAIAAACGRNGDNQSLDIPLADVQTTAQITKAVALTPQVTSLAFRPWVSENKVTSVFADLQRLPNLMCLDVSGMYLTHALCKGLCGFLAPMPSLTSLQLAECGITDAKLADLLPSVCQLPNLQELSVKKNDFGVQGALRLAAHFSLLTNLRSLNVAYTGMPESLYFNPKRSFPKTLPDACKSIPDEDLQCPVNWISKGMWIFCRCLKHLVNLEQLDISCPKLTLRHDVYHALCSVASQLPKCAKINHRSNHVIQPPPTAAPTKASRYASDLAALSSGDADAFCMMHPCHIDAIECSAMQDVLEVLPKSVSKLHLEVMLEADRERQATDDKPVKSLADIDVPTQVTSLSMTIHGLATGANAFIAALSSLTSLQHLKVICLEDTGMSETASCLPAFKHLTALELAVDDPDGDAGPFSAVDEFDDDARPGAPAISKYMVTLASALQQLPALQDLSLTLPQLAASDSELLQSSVADLQGLTRLSLMQPSVEILQALSPVVPNQALEALSVCTDRRGCIRPLLANAARLTALKSCSLLAVDDLDRDLDKELTALLTHITAVTKLSLSLVPTNMLSPRPGPGWTVVDTAELVAAARGLKNLRWLGLQSICWRPGMAELVQPQLPDSVWSQLTYLDFSAFSYELDTLWDDVMPDVPGSLVCRALCACEQLAHLSVRSCKLKLEDIECLAQRTQFPCLRVLRLHRISMDCSTAECLGHAVNAMQLPCLEEFSVKLACSYSTLEATSRTLCCFVQELRALQLPSVQLLHIVTDPSESFEEMDCTDLELAESASSTIGNTITNLLSSTFRLQSLNLVLPGISQEQVHAFLPTLGGHAALTELRLGAKIDEVCAGTLLMHLQGHRALRSVMFVHCSMLDSCVDPLYEWLKSLPDLRCVYFTASIVLEEKVRQLCEAVKNGSKGLNGVRHIESCTWSWHSLLLHTRSCLKT